MQGIGAEVLNFRGTGRLSGRLSFMKVRISKKKRCSWLNNDIKANIGLSFLHLIRLKLGLAFIQNPTTKKASCVEALRIYVIQVVPG